MEVTLRWDEAKLGKLVDEARVARRRVRNVAWVMIAVGLLVPQVLKASRPVLERVPAVRTLMPTSQSSAPTLPVPAPPQPPRERAPEEDSTIPFLVVMFCLGVGLLYWPSLRPGAWTMLLLGSLLGVAGLAVLALQAVDDLVWHTGAGLTSREVDVCWLLVILGAIQLYCSLILRRGSTVFACDYVKGEVADWSVVLGLLSAEGPDYQRLREQVGLR